MFHLVIWKIKSCENIQAPISNQWDDSNSSINQWNVSAIQRQTTKMIKNRPYLYNFLVISYKGRFPEKKEDILGHCPKRREGVNLKT